MQRSSSDTPIRQHALEQFAHLGYTIIDGTQEEYGTCTATGRQDTSEVVLLPQLRHALHALNPDCSSDLLDKAIDRLTNNLSLLSLVHANEQIHTLLRDGVKIEASGESASPTAGAQQEKHRTLQVINWREPESDQNQFTLVSRFWVAGKLGKRCLDLVGFVNGLPLILLESAASELPNTFNRIDQDYKTTIPALFWYNAFIVVADAFTCKMGSLTTPWEHFFQWKRINDEREDESTRLTTLIDGTCHKERLLDIVENFTIFNRQQGLSKLVARNHQYLGVNNAIASLRAWEAQRAARTLSAQHEEARHGKLGVFWHTQGSGKSYSMVFFVRKVQRTISNDYTFLVVTDRDDLDTQIFDNFHYTNTILEDPKEVHAQRGKHLQRLLSEKHLLLFTLIQKFRSEKPGQNYPQLSEREKIIVLADEAHRTQYDTLAKNMRDALPAASFLGFTGTPLMDGEEQTRATFGRYVSIYNFRRAIDDGVTVPLFYENHTPQIETTNDNFQEEMAALLEDARLDEQQEQRIFEQYAAQGNFFVKGERLDQVAADIVRHFMNRGYMGKAMVVSIDKITAIRTYNRVQEQRRIYKEELLAQLEQESDADSRAALASKIAYLDETDMAVVVSSSEGDAQRCADFTEKTGEQVDIMPHHQRFRDQKLADDFKKAEHPLRIAFVCAMWMTGFDVPCLSTIYLDRPLKDHTLMQTIARANRVYRDKYNGLIIDYAGNTHALKAALNIYAREDTSYHAGDSPIGNKKDLVQALRNSLQETEQFCREQGIDVPDLLTKLAAAADKQSQEDLVQPAIDSLLVLDEIKLRALLLTSEVSKLYKAILPDAAEKEFTLPVQLYRLIKSGIYDTMRPADISYTLGRAKTLVRESLEVLEREERLSADTHQPRGNFDLRAIDLDALSADLHSGHRHIKAEQLRQMLYEQIRRMIQVNPSRVTYMEKLERAVARYNEGSANLVTDPQLLDPQQKITPHPSLAIERLQDEYTDDLVALVTDVAHEEQRHEQEELNEEELAIFDLLTVHIVLNEEEHAQFRAMARDLLTELYPLFRIPDWQKNPQVSNQARVIIDDHLLTQPQAYAQEERRQQICDAIFLYVQERHRSDDRDFVA